MVKHSIYQTLWNTQFGILVKHSIQLTCPLPNPASLSNTPSCIPDKHLMYHSCSNMIYQHSKTLNSTSMSKWLTMHPSHTLDQETFQTFSPASVADNQSSISVKDPNQDPGEIHIQAFPQSLGQASLWNTQPSTFIKNSIKQSRQTFNCPSLPIT